MKTRHPPVPAVPLHHKMGVKGKVSDSSCCPTSPVEEEEGVPDQHTHTHTHTHTHEPKCSQTHPHSWRSTHAIVDSVAVPGQ
eukprot:566442-Pelagomonas_calceolata.AAC.2